MTRLSMLLALGLLTQIAAAQEEEAVIPCQEEPTDQIIEYTDIITCTIDTTSDIDVFRFSAQSGDHVLIQHSDNSTSSSAVASFEVISSSGTTILETTDRLIIFTADSTGVYTILVRDANADSTYSYTFNLERIFPISESANFICQGCTEQGTLISSPDADFFRLDAQSGDRFIFQISDNSTSSRAVPSVTVFNPMDQEIDTFNDSLQFAAETTGTFLVWVRDEGFDSTYSYDLSLICVFGPCANLPANCALTSEAAADVELSRQGVVKSGDVFAVGFSIFNRGPAQANDILFEYEVPEDAFLQNFSASEGDCQQETGRVTCRFDALAAQRRVNVSVSVRPSQDAQSSLSSSARIGSGDCDPDSANDQVTAIIDLPVDVPQIELVFPQLVDGGTSGLRFRSNLILSNSGQSTQVHLEFRRTPDGAPMELELVGLGEGSSFEFELDKGQTRSISTTGAGPLSVGYARVRGGEGLSGILVFNRIDLDTGISLAETPVPSAGLLTEFSILVDTLEERDTGLALAYPVENVQSSAPVNLSLQLFDASFNLIAETDLPPLEANGHLARFVNELFQDPEIQVQAREIEGLLVVSADQPVAAVTLRQTDDPDLDFPAEVPALSAFPVIPGRPIP